MRLGYLATEAIEMVSVRGEDAEQNSGEMIKDTKQWWSGGRGEAGKREKAGRNRWKRKQRCAPMQP